MSQTIVSRGEWLGRPAKLKRTGYCLAFEGETGCHVCITAASILNKMVEDSDPFLFEDDLDAVLEALEANDIVDESFNEAVTEVRQIISEFFFLNSLFYAVLRRFYLQFPFFTHS